MRSGFVTSTLLLAAACCGCAEKTYQVNFRNDSPVPTDFLVDEVGVDSDTFVLDLEADGGAVSVEHVGRKVNVTISSGIIVGQQMTVTDATTTAQVFDGAVVDVVKNADGSLESTVSSSFPFQGFIQSTTKAVRSALPGGRTPRR